MVCFTMFTYSMLVAASRTLYESNDVVYSYDFLKNSHVIARDFIQVLFDSISCTSIVQRAGYNQLS